MPAFIESVKDSLPGYGSASNYGSIIGNAVNAGAGQTMVIPATGATTPSSGGTAFNLNGGPAPSRGRGRVRMTALGGATTLTITSITVTDGTTVLLVYAAAATPASSLVDFTYEFNTDLAITSTTMTFTTGTSGGTIDWEVAMV
jgi:hypothetical protein